MGREVLKWRQSAQHSKDLILVHTVQLKPMIKPHSETCLKKKKTMMIIIMNKLIVISCHQKLTSAMKLMLEK